MTGRTADRRRTGRTRVTAANEDRHLRILRKRFLTVRHRLRQHCIGAYRPFRGMTLTRQHRLRRLRWQHRKWHVYSFLMRAGSIYSSLTAGLRCTDVLEREQLRAVFRRLYRLVVDLRWFGAVSEMVWGAVCGQQTVLSLTEVLHRTRLCTWWTCTPLKQVLCAQI